MAVTVIKKQIIGFNSPKAITFTALTSASDGFGVDWDVADERALLLVQNTGSSPATVTVKAGNGLQGVTPLSSHSVANGGMSAIALESGAFKNVFGDNKGKVMITGSSTDLKMALVQLY